MEEPDRWIVVKVGVNQKIFGMWSGGYLDGWKLNSGIESVEEEGDFYLFKGFSGSIYKCHKLYYGVTAFGANVLNFWGDEVEALTSLEEAMLLIRSKCNGSIKV